MTDQEHAPQAADRPVVVTGAAGFLGRRVVAAARAAGRPVRAVARTRAAAQAAGLVETPGLTILAADLATEDGARALAEAARDAAAVVHAAAAMGGDDAAQARDTVGPTATLIEALLAAPTPPRLVLISSLAVCNFAALPDGATLDETAPAEPSPARRDAYCRAKLAQEALARAAAQERGLAVFALRPGAVFGPGRVWTARLGLRLGPVAAGVGGGAAIPACDVEHAADAAARACAAPFTRSDAPIFGPGGAWEAIHLIDDETPSQRAWLAALRAAGRAPRLLWAPRAPLRAAATALSLGGDLAPLILRIAPGALRLEAQEARFKPLRYSNARLRDRLGWTPRRGFAEAMRAALETEA